MVRPARYSLCLLALASGTLRAQLPAAIAAPPALSPGDGTPAPAASAAPKPRVTHAMSPEVAAQLAAARPKFTPVAPPPPPKPEEELPDMRDIDKPKNTIVRLPKYVVQEQRPPVFTEREIHTQQGLANLAMRRYMTETDRALNRFTLPLFGISSADRALAMYAEDERLKNMGDMADQTNMVMKSDAAAGKKVQDASRQTFMRWQDFGWQGGNK
jgi:hypothetical protein